MRVLIRGAGDLASGIGTRADSKYQPGQIVEQDPSAGRTRKGNLVIRVYVCAEEEKYMMPDVRNLTLQKAKLELNNMNLSLQIETSEEFSDTVAEGSVISTSPAVGSEIKFRTGDDWLRTAGMNVFSAVAGKLLPYTVIFVLISVLANYVLFGVMRIPFSCGFWPLNLTSALFVVATQCLAVFLFSLFPAIGIVISVVSMVGSLGATLSGVTFPAPFMYEPVYYASFLFPVRHFVEISQNLLYGDYGFAYTWQNVAALLLFALPALLVLPRLKKAVLSRRYENIK